MNGHAYEKACVGYLRRHGYSGVTLTGNSGDYGVDIICRRLIKRYAVQCKYYSRPVGVAAVQQVVGGMAYYDCDRAIVITNTTFTRQAYELAERNNVTLIHGYDGRTGLRVKLFILIVLLVIANIAVNYYL
ncbi:MAG: restriction endonuclease [Clostridiales bacterium]|nr:restriction endonuclease [Clostridiales bacterium]